MILLIPERLWHHDQYWSDELALLVEETSGEIVDLLPKNVASAYTIKEIAGDLIPGFINTHCHLELSHIHSKIPTRTGMRGFVQAINTFRNGSSPEEEISSMQGADRQMWNAGIVAVGDIANDDRSLAIKMESSIYYHTFIELFGWNAANYEALFINAADWQTKFEKAGASSIVPHAPYSVPPLLFTHLRNLGKEDNVWTIHHAESDAEMSLFGNCSGDLAEFLKGIGIKLNQESFNNYQSPTHYILSEWPTEKKSIWVHNTRMAEEGLQVAMSTLKENLYLCTCPNANLYIEERLPDYEMWMRNGVQVCIGTDSLASNHTLSIWDELITIQTHAQIPLEKTLTWATLNGAKALGIENNFGSLQKGKKPGILMIDATENIQRLF